MACKMYFLCYSPDDATFTDCIYDYMYHRCRLPVDSKLTSTEGFAVHPAYRFDSAFHYHVPKCPEFFIKHVAIDFIVEKSSCLFIPGVFNPNSTKRMDTLRWSMDHLMWDRTLSLTPIYELFGSVVYRVSDNDDRFSKAT